MDKDKVIEKHFKLITEHFGRNEYNIAIPWVDHKSISVGYGEYIYPFESKITSVQITREEFLAHKWNTKLWKALYG